MSRPETVEVTNDDVCSIEKESAIDNNVHRDKALLHLTLTHELPKVRQKSKIQFLVFIFGKLFCCRIAYVAKKNLACVRVIFAEAEY